eukprot:TRINITY_DN644_c5_g1_i1.p1 TRINITY_DN644_c5_g1~~TRINITY_DN644_c5_g1_i1.p1  ORF type:complete len:141 (+),score=48.90 TRINITY_DN644_c5_g1_i1:38-424(+)
MRQMLACVCLALLCAATGARGDGAVHTAEEEQHWDSQTKAVLHKIAESHAQELQSLEGGDMSDGAEAELRDRLKRNIAVQLYRLVIAHPLGSGKMRVRSAFEASPLKKFFFWDDLFPPDDDLLPEDEM